jgi:hypothetical protein
MEPSHPIHLGEQESIGDYLCREGYSDVFRDDYIIPMIIAIWSTSPDKCSLEFPAITRPLRSCHTSHPRRSSHGHYSRDSNTGRNWSSASIQNEPKSCRTTLRSLGMCFSFQWEIANHPLQLMPKRKTAWTWRSALQISPVCNIRQKITPRVTRINWCSSSWSRCRLR